MDFAERIMEALTPLSRGELEQFISVHPLYSRLSTMLPEHIMSIAPKVVFVYCDRCKARLPFRALPEDKWFIPVAERHIARKGPLANALRPKMSGTYEFFFRCSGCDIRQFICWVEVEFEDSYIRKVGQTIPWSVDIGKELEKDLGDDAHNYKKALMLLSQSYGIGACVYLRRIIENQINPILEILLEMRKQENADASEISRISEAIQRKDFTSKIETAAELLPESILVDGDNPVKLLHDQLSVNIHSLTDDEVIPIALQLKTAFEYVVVELNRRKRSKQKFIEGIKALRKT